MKMFKKNKRQQTAYTQGQEAFRVMANQLKKYQEQGKKCIAFTSHQKEQGKSYMIQSVANILSRGGSKVLVLDANVFKGTLTHLYDQRLEFGLLDILEKMSEEGVDCLSREQLLEGYVYEIKESNIYCLPKGGDGQEIIYERLIQEKYLKAILAELRSAFDYILVEVPSFECLSYTQIMTTAVDGCILVLKSGELQISDAGAVKEQISSLGCEMLSCVLNEKEEILYRLSKEESVKQTKEITKQKEKEITLRASEGVAI
ncbi:MAG: hypothetical protein ACRCW2_04835 [Cellulosilyticaceae bacterium]